MANALAVGNRTVSWDEVGDPEGIVVFHLHGAGGSRLEINRMHEAALAAGICLVGLDRPGYGGTTDLTLATPGDMAGDLAALADSMGLDTFFVSGLSAGGMFALAMANALPKRVTRVITINGAPPIADPVIGPLAPKKLQFVAKLARKRPGLVKFLLEKTAGGKKADDPKLVIKRMKRESPADGRLFENDAEALRLMIEASKVGRQQGLSPSVRDFALAATPWGFDVRSLACEVVVVNGSEDPLLPANTKLAAEVPRASFVGIPGGHVAVLNPAVFPALMGAMAHGAPAMTV